MSSGEPKLPLEADSFTATVLGYFKRHTQIGQARVFAKLIGKTPEIILGLYVYDYEEVAKLIGGVFTLKLLYLLSAMGIEMPEVQLIEEGNPVGAYIGQLLAYDIIDMNKACTEACEGDIRVQPGAVLRACRGGQLLRPANLNSLTRNYGDALKKKREAFLEELRNTKTWPTQLPPESALETRGVLRVLADELGLNPETLVARLQETPPQPATPSGDDDQGAFILEVAKSIMLTLTQVNRALQILNSQELAKLRELTGTGGNSNGAFSLHLALLEISGSRARAQLRGE